MVDTPLPRRRQGLVFLRVIATHETENATVPDCRRTLTQLEEEYKMKLLDKVLLTGYEAAPNVYREHRKT